MDKQAENIQAVETGLRIVYQTPVPDAAFVQNLEQTLTRCERTAHPPSWWQRRTHTHTHPRPRHTRWATAALVTLLLLALTVTAIGPQRVWAALQGWMGFIPGFGFVDVNTVRILKEPVVVSSADLTASVTRAVIIDETAITFEISDLPKTDAFSERFEDIGTLDVKLHLATGTCLTPTILRPYRSSQDAITAYATFEKLPPKIDHAVLTVVASDTTHTFTLPQQGLWLPFDLLTIDEDTFAEHFPQSHIPDSITDANYGIELAITNVAYSDEETAVQITWQTDTTWQRASGYPDHMIDQAYQFYSPSYDILMKDMPSLGKTNTSQRPQSFVFPPLKPETEHLTLTVSSVSVYTNSVPFPITFTVDLGNVPQHGQTYPLDIAFEVAGFSYHFSQATFKFVEAITNTNSLVHWDNEIQYVLDVDFETQPKNKNLQSSVLTMHIHNYRDYYGLNYTDNLDGTRHWRASFCFIDYPTGEVDIGVHGAWYHLRGPWRVTWAVP